MKHEYPKLPADQDTWINAESRSNGRPMMLRLRPDLEAFTGKHAFQEKLVFIWEFGDSKEHAGLPSETHFSQMRPFEEALVASLEGSRCAIFAYAHTGKGICERHFYIKTLDSVKEDLDSVLKQFPGLPLSIKCYDDADWSEYMEMLHRLQ